MSLIVEVGKVLGLPGAVLFVWYLIEKQKLDRAAKLDESRAASEDRRTEAITEGFRNLGGLITDHARADLESHGEQTERIARIEGVLEIKRRTPATGIGIIRETSRAKTGGDR